MTSSVVPPNISLIIEKNDTLELSEEQEEIVLEQSRAYWYDIAPLAYAYLDQGLTPEFINPQRSLYKTPRLQGHRPLGTTLNRRPLLISIFYLTTGGKFRP